MTKIQLTWLSSMSALFWFLRRLSPFSTITKVEPGQSKNDIFVAVYDLNKDTIKHDWKTFSLKALENDFETDF